MPSRSPSNADGRRRWIAGRQPFPHAFDDQSLGGRTCRCFLGVEHQTGQPRGQYVEFDPGGIFEIPGHDAGLLQRRAHGDRAIAAQYDGPRVSQRIGGGRCEAIVANQARVAPERCLRSEVAAEAVSASGVRPNEDSDMMRGD